MSKNQLFKHYCLPSMGRVLSEKEIKIAKHAFKLGMKAADNKQPNAWLSISPDDECAIVSSPIAPVGHKCLPIFIPEDNK